MSAYGMICLYAGLISASARGRKKLFPRDRNAPRYCCGSNLRPWKAPSSSNKLRRTTSTFSFGTLMNLSFRAERSEVEESRCNAHSFAAGCLDFAQHDKGILERVCDAHLRSERVQAGIRIRLSAVGEMLV